MDAFYQKMIALSVLMNIVVACDTEEQLTKDSKTQSATIVQHNATVDTGKTIKSCQRLMTLCRIQQQ